ncbi:hypothetical protein SCHPADRAFT_897455, partial [Schizopora paradoxa]
SYTAGTNGNSNEFTMRLMKCEKEGQAKKAIKAQKLKHAILEAHNESGTLHELQRCREPYLKDTHTGKSKQQNLGTMKSSNSCTEIFEYSSSTFDLNRVIDANYYLPSTRSQTLQHAPPPHRHWRPGQSGKRGQITIRLVGCGALFLSGLVFTQGEDRADWLRNSLLARPYQLPRQARSLGTTGDSSHARATSTLVVSYLECSKSYALGFFATCFGWVFWTRRRACIYYEWKRGHKTGIYIMHTRPAPQTIRFIVD